MPATVTGIHLGPDTHANRPAANASGLPIGALYMCSDHSLIYQTDGSAWSTWATLGGGAVAAEDVSITDSGAYFTGTDVEAALQELGAGGGGGGGSAWTLTVDEDGTTDTNWTQVSGSWASNGTVIVGTNTAATERFMRYNTPIPQVGLIVQADIQFPTTGQPGTTNQAGIFFNGTTTQPGHGVVLKKDASAPRIYLRNYGVGDFDIVTPTNFAYDTWYTLRYHFAGGRWAVWLDGTFQTSANYTITASSTNSYLVLNNFNSVAWYRNIKVWTPTMPA